MRIVPFRAEHLTQLDLQRQQAFIGPHLSLEGGLFLEHAGPAYSAVHGSSIAGCAGVVRVGDHRAVVWALMAETGPAVFLRIHRAVRRWLDGDDTPRVETYIRCDHEEGHRWAKSLGFERECGPMRRFDPAGNDYDIYVRFNV